MNKNKLIAVYGTLRQNQGNWYHLLKDKSNYLGTFKSESTFTMYHLGGFPGIIEKGNTSIVLEVFEIDDIIAERVHRLEGYSPNRPKEANMYNAIPINTPYGEAMVYVINPNYIRKDHIITSGDWVNQN